MFEGGFEYTSGLISKVKPLEVNVGGTTHRVDVCYPTDYTIGDEVAVVLGKSETTPDGQYCEVDLLPVDKGADSNYPYNV